MVGASNLHSAINRQQANSASNHLSSLEAKGSSNTLPSTANSVHGGDALSFSEVAKKLFADKNKTDTEIIQGLIDKGMGMLREKSGLPSEIQRAYGLTALYGKVGNSANRLDELIAQLRDAFTSGDKAASSAIEKDIALFFRGMESPPAGSLGATEK